jgi:hypothetical protein
MVVCISLLKPRAFKLPSARGASGLNIWTYVIKLIKKVCLQVTWLFFHYTFSYFFY